ncbi:autophagy-related protein 27-domain-containing protein [Cyathus striatus]|nr:autophagy-related protein 27-domain-containing protein [Cyathus striatus]
MSLTCEYTHNSPPLVLTYDLCPLPSPSSSSSQLHLPYEGETPPTRTSYIYDIALRPGGVEFDKTLPADLQCEKGTWACLTVLNTRPDHPSETKRILQIIPLATEAHLHPQSKLVSLTAKEKEETLQLAMHGGMYMGQRQKIVFRFLCSKDHNYKGPKFKWRFNGTHMFHWESPHGCPRRIMYATRPPPGGSPPSEEEGEDGEGEGDDGPPDDPESGDDPGEENGNGRASYIWGTSIIILLIILFILRRFFSSTRLERIIRWYPPWLRGRSRNDEGYARLDRDVPLSPVEEWDRERGGKDRKGRGYGSVAAGS